MHRRAKARLYLLYTYLRQSTWHPVGSSFRRHTYALAFFQRCTIHPVGSGFFSRSVCTPKPANGLPVVNKTTTWRTVKAGFLNSPPPPSLSLSLSLSDSPFLPLPGDVRQPSYSLAGRWCTPQTTGPVLLVYTDFLFGKLPATDRYMKKANCKRHRRTLNCEWRTRRTGKSGFKIVVLGVDLDKSGQIGFFLGRRVGRRVSVSKSGVSRRERDGWQVCRPESLLFKFSRPLAETYVFSWIEQQK